LDIYKCPLLKFDLLFQFTLFFDGYIIIDIIIDIIIKNNVFT
jgi:hypothetical protein